MNWLSGLRQRVSTICWAGGVCLLLLLATRLADPIILDFDGALNEKGAPTPWVLKVKTGTPNVEREHAPNGRAMKLTCASSSFSLNRKVTLSPDEYPLLRWDWMVTALPEAGDVRDTKKNDQAAQVLLLFRGREVLSYVWDSNAPAGTVVDEVATLSFIQRLLAGIAGVRIKVVVVASGAADLNQWMHVERNISDDYRTLFGKPPPALRGLRVQCNSQYTRAVGTGHFGKLVFSPANADG